MDAGMQRLHPAVHDFGKAGELGDVPHRQGPAAASALAVPPVETSSTPRPARPWRNRQARSCRKRRAAHGGSSPDLAAVWRWLSRTWFRLPQNLLAVWLKRRRNRRQGCANGSTGGFALVIVGLPRRDNARRRLPTCPSGVRIIPSEDRFQSPLTRPAASARDPIGSNRHYLTDSVACRVRGSVSVAG